MRTAESIDAPSASLDLNYRWPAEMNPALADGIIDLYNDSIRTEDILGYQEALSAAEAERVIDRLSQSMHYGDKHFFGIYSRSDLIGMALLAPNSLPNCRHIVEWSKGIIHSRYRGRNVLRPSLQALAQRCTELGWEIVTLDVRANSRSHKLWSLAGFQEYGYLPDYARIKGKTLAGAYLYANVSEIMLRTGVADVQ